MFLPINGLINKGVTWIGGLRANGGGGVVCRNVSNFNGVDSYAQFDNDIVLAGSFQADFDVILNDTTSYKDSLSGSGLGLAFRGNGQVSISATGNFQISPVNTYVADTPYKASIVRGGGFVRVFIDDIAVLFVNDGGGSVHIQFIASEMGANNFLSGKFSNLKVWGGGDRDTGTLLVDLPMDESSETSTVNYINRTGNTDYNATGYNIIVTEECEADASAWNDTEGFNDPEEWND